MRSNPHRIIKHYFTSTDLKYFDNLEYQILERGAITIDTYIIHANVHKDEFALNVIDEWLCEITLKKMFSRGLTFSRNIQPQHYTAKLTI